MREDFKYVSYLWSDEEAAALNNNEVDELIYRSNLLGSDLRITNFGGGNTSCKVLAIDPISKKSVEVMWVKGSGGDLGTMKRSGLASLYVNKLKSLIDFYQGKSQEDEMVELFNHCIYSLDSKAPSIDTPLHCFLPFKHIDHLHPDAVIAIASSKDGEKITKDIFGNTIGWLPWQRPGFDLGLKLMKYQQENPQLQGIILQSHGLFTWGETSFECYVKSLSIIEKCAAFINLQQKFHNYPFGKPAVETVDFEKRKSIAAQLLPALRKHCSSQNLTVGHYSDSQPILEFVNSTNLHSLAALGTSCPDHFLRTKISPLVLDIAPNQIINRELDIDKTVSQAFEKYRKEYTSYYDSHKHANSPSIRNANPVIILLPGVGMFSFAKNKETARIAGEFYTNAINVIKGAEAISTYTSLPKQEAFDIEYWLLEEAKLQRMPNSKPLEGKIALITGSGGGIGKAIAKKLASEGACIALSDNSRDRLDETKIEFESLFGKDRIASYLLDVTNSKSINEAMHQIVLKFGGLDILVNNAGISISKTIEEHSEDDWDLLYDILVKGQMLVSQAAIKIMKIQQLGGDIINIVSKNSLVSGPNNAGYGSAKAAQLHLSRLHAAELGNEKIRVNVVNPDAVIVGSNIWSSGWAAGRAKAYGITVEELPQYYAKRTLLNEIIFPEDIANACFALVGGLLNKSTGNILNVDGGIATAFPR